MKKLTLAPEKLWMRDTDGNAYKTYRVGNLLISDNLKVEHYSDGTPIPVIERNEDWDCGKGAACYYDNNKSNEQYGALYNFYAVETGKLAPEGWHVPSDEEWDYINSFIGDNDNIIKSLCLEMGGYRSTNGYGFYYLGSSGYWWSSTPYSSTNAWYRTLNSSATVGTTLGRFNHHRSYGFSVRCVRNLKEEEIDLFDNSTIKNKSLARFTTTQLINELKRRGFKGELSKNTIFKI